MTTADFNLDCDLSELSEERFAVLKSLDISRLFRHWSLRNHPDKGADSEKFKDVSNLNEEISNIIRIEAEKRWTLDLSRKRASAKKKATERLLACVYRAVLSKQFQKYKFQVLPLPETAENIIHALDHRSEVLRPHASPLHVLVQQLGKGPQKSVFPCFFNKPGNQYAHLSLQRCRDCSLIYGSPAYLTKFGIAIVEIEYYLGLWIH